jgi:hypothetical protein
MAPAWPASAARDARWPARSNCGMRRSCGCAGVLAHMRTETLRPAGRWRGRRRCPVQLPPTPCPHRGRTIGRTTPGAASHPDSTCGPRARPVHGPIHRGGAENGHAPASFGRCGTNTPRAAASPVIARRQTYELLRAQSFPCVPTQRVQANAWQRHACKGKTMGGSGYSDVTPGKATAEA